MFGIEAGDLPGWIGATTGIGAILWNGLRAFNASRIRDQMRITAWLIQSGSGDTVTVQFLNADRHTGYRLTISCRQPSRLQIRPAPETQAEKLYGTGEPQTQPVTLPMARTPEDVAIVQARFIARGANSNVPLRLTLTVREASGRICAKRKLALSPG